MKITIELTDAEVKGIKEYLKEVSHDIHPKITKEDIKIEVRGMVSAELQAGALGDYIRKYQNQQS